MRFLNKPLDDITEADLNSLVGTGVPESKTLDYKRELPGPSDKEKKEFAKDICAFANGVGGVIAYGIEEQDRVATGISGLEADDIDEQMTRLQSMARTSLSPNLVGTHCVHVPLDGGRCVILLGVPRSWAAPHRVSFQNYNRFFVRASAEKHEMAVDELRAAFEVRSDLATRIRDFRTARLGRILSGETPVALEKGPVLVVHLIPLWAFRQSELISMGDLNGLDDVLAPPGSDHCNGVRYNLDGFVSYQPMSRSSEPVSYMQLFREGIIEAGDVDAVSPGADESVPTHILGDHLVEAVARYLKLLYKLGVDPPISLGVALLGVEKMSLAQGRMTPGPRASFDRNEIILPPVLIEEVIEDVPRFLRPTFDTIWNAAGRKYTDLYDDDGKWRPPRSH